MYNYPTVVKKKLGDSVMSALKKTTKQKVEKFIKHLKTLENATPSEREKAIHMLTEALQGKHLYLVKSSRSNDNGLVQKDLADKNLAQELHAARTRLEDIHSRLELTIKSGNANGTMH